MKDAEYAEHRERVRRLFERWVPALHLNRWRLVFEFVREEPEKTGSRATVMDVRALWEYQEARISVYMPVVAHLARHDDDLEWHVVHELLHCHLGELRESEQEPSRDYRQHEERVCSTLATVILHGVRDAIVSDPEAWRRSEPERPTIRIEEEEG